MFHIKTYGKLFHVVQTVTTILFSFVAHFLPRSPTEPLTVNTAKEDEVTSSEEAGPIETRIEPKGKNFLVEISLVYRNTTVCSNDEYLWIL